MKKNAKPAALAILVLAAVAALSVGITLAVAPFFPDFATAERP